MIHLDWYLKLLSTNTAFPGMGKEQSDKFCNLAVYLVQRISIKQMDFCHHLYVSAHKQFIFSLSGPLSNFKIQSGRWVKKWHCQPRPIHFGALPASILSPCNFIFRRKDDFLRIPELAINPLADRIVNAFFPDGYEVNIFFSLNK